MKAINLNFAELNWPDDVVYEENGDILHSYTKDIVSKLLHKDSSKRATSKGHTLLLKIDFVLP